MASAASPDELAALINQPVQLRLNNGRLPRGVYSPKSTGEWYVLLTDLPDIMIESRFASRIVQDIQPLSGSDARQDNSRDLSVPLPPAPAPALPEESGMSSPISDSPFNERDMPTCAPQAIDPISSWAILPTNNPLSTPRSLNIDTTAANWDTDLENDGLLLHVTPLNGWGQVVPVEGVLDVQLLTETKFATGGRTVSRNQHFQVAERWSVPIHAIEINIDGAVYKLPFRRIHPGRDLDITPDAMLVVRLRIPSVGTIDAIDSFVRLRAASRVREDFYLQQDSHRPSGHR